MVCQSSGQTRFRALKHLSGTAGSATIIVRVIACFQPLQDCQVGPQFWVLLLLLKWTHFSYGGLGQKMVCMNET